MMETKIIAKVTAERKLELPAEIQAKLQPGEEYLISLTEDSITLKKSQKPEVDLNEFFRNLEQMEPDPNQPTLQEISEMVKEARKKKALQTMRIVQFL